MPFDFVFIFFRKRNRFSQAREFERRFLATLVEGYCAMQSSVIIRALYDRTHVLVNGELTRTHIRSLREREGADANLPELSAF